YAAWKSALWYDWGPIHYRGRLNKSARVLCIAQDPGATERIAGRTLVGDAGQRVQGFLSKLGLTKSYVCLNAFAYAVIPSKMAQAEPLLTNAAQVAWRNQLFGLVTGPKLQAIVAFGKKAQDVVALWPGHGGVPIVKVPHPSSHDPVALINAWRQAVITLRGVVTPDSVAKSKGPNYSAAFTAADYAAIPRADLPYGVPAALGDDAWMRALDPAHPSSVRRPDPDDRHTLIWKVPAS
ncbi:MAG TPA: uracil-DNA glycosylase family protein, partial [Gemmatimonadales bacterium]|nr:uracil-DNA glycosylase family protein [Gemmatimonadales bacterium]